MIKIYCLIDPRNDSPFYVGATNCQLSTRLSGHIFDAKRYVAHPPFRNDTISGDKHRLIYELLQLDKKPRIKRLTTVSKITANYYEQFFYTMFIVQGFRMLQLESAFNYYESKTNSRFNKPEYLQLMPVGKTLTNNNCKIIR